MKPFKSGKGVANWLLRIALIAMLYHVYSNVISTWTFTNLSFIIAVVAILLGIMIIVGGVLSKPGLTIVAGLLLTLLSLYKMVITFNGNINQYLIAQFIPLAIGFYFFTNGNDN